MSGPGSYGVTALCWVLVHVKSCVHPPRVESLFFPVLHSIPTSLQSQILWGLLLPVLDPQAGKPDWGSELSLTSRTSVIQLFSSLWVTPLAGRGFDYIPKSPLLPSPYGFFFVFGCKLSFLVDSSLFFPNGSSAINCDFGVFVRGGVYKSFYYIILSGILIC